MSDTYGSGLAFGSPDGGGPAFGGTSQPSAPDVPMDLSPQPAAQAAPQPSFGSSIAKMLPGAHYVPPDPQLPALDQSAALLEQRVKRANQISTNPIAEFFAPEQVATARAFVPQATEMLQKIQTQKSAIQAGRTQAETLGLTPGQVPDQATDADRTEAAVAGALKGNLRNFQGLAAVNPQRAAAIQDRVHEVVAGHLDKAQFAFDSLASMQNEGQYQAKIRQLKQDGALADLEALGLKLPQTFEAFGATKGAEAKALREARIAVQTLQARIEERSGGTPMEKKEAETYKGRLTTEQGDELNNITWSRINGKRVAGVNGMADIRDLGKKFNFMSPEQRKAFHEDAKAAIPEKEIEKARSFERIGTLATKDANGAYIPPEGLVNKKGERIFLNTNPNVMQGLAEGFAAELRGGQGGATGGLLNIEAGKRGAVQALLDKLKAAYGGAVNTLTGDQVKSYLTTLTEKQQRQVLDGLREYNEKSISNRALPLAQRVGALGGDASALGLGKGEFKGIEDAIEAGRQSTINRFTPRARATSGGDGGIYLDNPPPMLITQSDNPNVQHPPVPPPVTPPAASQPNGGVQQPPPSQPGLQPGGGGSPSPGQQSVTIAGQPVVMPPGVPPTYAQATQRIESGNERDPWTATAKGSSASGAFQFIDSTWRENKPAGAPDRAKDATPAQQAEAFATLTAKNALALKANNVPVNDTTLYVAHNLGAGSAAELLQSDPAMEARRVVGEKAARNNPMFFRGNPTVATVLQRYASAVAGIQNDGSELPVKQQLGNKTVADFAGTAAHTVLQAFPPTALMTTVWDRLSPAQKQTVKDAAIENAPAIGSTGGAIVGGVVGGPLGGVAGGAAGGGAGQALKDYLKGNSQDPVKIGEEAALGGVLGVGGLPRGLNMAARAIGASAVEGGASALKGGDIGDVAEAGAAGAGESLGGETFGRALGMAGHKVYSLFAPDARKAVQTAAKNYAEASEVLNTQQPKITSATGSVQNPEYVAAEVKKTKAETTLKDAGLNPEEAAYAHRVSAEGVPRQEAEVSRPGALEQQRVGEGYQQIEREVGDRGVGAVKPTPKLADGPITVAANQKMAPSMARTAERTEMAITAPAANWQEKWNQLKDARTALLDLERDALSSTTAGRTQQAKDYRALADSVRKQQEKAANYVFGPTEGAVVMKRLKVLDVRYRTLMEATNGMDLAGAARLKGAEGRAADKAFRAFAGNDTTAIAAWDAMRRGRSDVERDVRTGVLSEKIPFLGHVISAAKLATTYNEWRAARLAGSPAKFSDFIDLGDRGVRATRDVAGSVGARTAVQGNFNGLTQ